MIQLYRAKIGSFLAKDGFDVTVKGAQGFFGLVAPTWKMVLDYKAGKMLEGEYTTNYLIILKNAFDAGFVNKLLAIVDKQKLDRVVFNCYCPDNFFCHTYLLIDALVEQYLQHFEKGL